MVFMTASHAIYSAPGIILCTHGLSFINIDILPLALLLIAI